MKQHPGHRSSAIRAIIGGALVATMGAASAAWACTPVAVFDVKELSRSEEPISREVELKLTHSNPPEDGHIVIVEGNVLVDAEVREIGTKPMAKGVPVTVPAVVRLTTPGYHYFSAWTTGVDRNDVVRSSVRTAVYQVKPVAASTVDPATDTGSDTNRPTDPLVNPPANPLINPATNPDANPATNPATGPGAPTTPGAQPAPRPAASGGSAPVAARPAAATPAVAAVPAQREPIPAAAGPSVAPSSLGFQAPEPSSLWSGLDAARTPSLLDSPATTGSNGGLPVGGSLLAIGVLGLAGATVIATRRRLALARLAEQG